MDFDKEYVKFVQHITDPKKGGVMGPVKFSKEEDIFAKLFVAYLNCRYASAHLTSAMHSDGDKPGQFNVKLKTSELLKWKSTSKF